SIAKNGSESEPNWWIVSSMGPATVEVWCLVTQRVLEASTVNEPSGAAYGTHSLTEAVDLGTRTEPRAKMKMPTMAAANAAEPRNGTIADGIGFGRRRRVAASKYTARMNAPQTGLGSTGSNPNRRSFVTKT